MTRKEASEKLKHYIEMYSYSDSSKDREFLGKIFYYAGLLSEL